MSSRHNDHIEFKTPKSENSQISEDMEIVGPNVQPDSDYEINGVEEYKLLPLLGKPRFNVIVGKTNLKPHYTLNVPSTIKSLLPSFDVPVVFKYCGKKWVTSYKGIRSSIRWKEFVTDNNLKKGDGCIFELEENTSIGLTIRVQILRGDFPSQLMDKFDGSSAENPFIIDF